MVPTPPAARGVGTWANVGAVSLVTTGEACLHLLTMDVAPVFGTTVINVWRYLVAVEDDYGGAGCAHAARLEGFGVGWCDDTGCDCFRRIVGGYAVYDSFRGTFGGGDIRRQLEVLRVDVNCRDSIVLACPGYTGRTQHENVLFGVEAEDVCRCFGRRDISSGKNGVSKVGGARSGNVHATVGPKNNLDVLSGERRQAWERA